jgi:prevent-host-death family protein
MSQPVQISTDILPLGDFKANASRVLRGLRENRRAVVITQNGRPAAVLITPEDFDLLQEKTRFLQAVRYGLEDVENGRVTDDNDLGNKLDPGLGTVHEP